MRGRWTSCVWGGGLILAAAGLCTGVEAAPERRTGPVAMAGIGRFTLPPGPFVGPPTFPAQATPLTLRSIHPLTSARQSRSEDRNQFTAVRALNLDRGRSSRTALDARLQLTLTGDMGGVDTRVGVAGLPRMVQRALER